MTQPLPENPRRTYPSCYRNATGAGGICFFIVPADAPGLRLLRLYEGTTQIQQLVIGRQMLRAAA